MSQPKFRRRYELISYILNVAVPILLVVVLFQHHLQMKYNSQQIEDLRADIATIRVNTMPTPNAAYFISGESPSSDSSTNSTRK